MANNNYVFVIHGRNSAARKAMFAFLRALGLQPLEWSQLVKATGQGSPYIGDVLAKGFELAQAAIALMTPDDVGMLSEQYRGPNEPEHETKLTGQARQNVAFEAGMAMGSYPARTILVELGSLRPMSDIHGRHLIRMNDTQARRQELALRLKTAGCSVDMDGVDWHTEGKFDECIPKGSENYNESLKQLHKTIEAAAERKRGKAEPPKSLQEYASEAAAIDSGSKGKTVTPVVKEALTTSQIAVLLCVAWQLTDPDGSVSIYNVRSEAERNGVGDIAITLGLKALLLNGMLNKVVESGWNNEVEVSYGVTDAGMNWLVANEDGLPLRNDDTSRSERPKSSPPKYDDEDYRPTGPPANDDIPF